jgi:hypothetical protein
VSRRDGLRARFSLSDDDLAALFAPEGVENPFADKRAARLVVIRPEAPLAPPGTTPVFDQTTMSVMLQKGRAQARKVLGLS